MGGILVPVDLTEVSDRVLEVAGQIANDRGVEVVFLHVIETLRDVTVEEMKDFYQEIEERSHRLLGELRSDFVARGVQASVHVCYGSRVGRILEFVQEQRIELIVMMSHPIEDSSSAAQLATISYQVAALSQCSVHLVKLAPESDRGLGTDE